MAWKIEDIEVGDYVRVQIVNKQGDRNLDGAIMSGTIAEIKPDHEMARLDSGWCVHTKDDMLGHWKNRKEQKEE